MKWLKELEDFTTYILGNKERAANRHANQLHSEKPREVFDRACQLIADQLKEAGFNYYPSQHKLKLDCPDKKLSLFVKFSSNRDNVAGQFVELQAYFYISSRALRTHSKKHPLLDYWNDTIFRSDIGTLINSGQGKVVWNLANKNEFEDATSLIPKVIHERLLRAFEDFYDSENILAEIGKGNFDLDNPITTVQYLLMVDRQGTAEQYLSNFLTRKPEKILEDYKEAFALFKSKGTPAEYTHGMGYGYEIALLEHEYELKVEVPKDT